MEIINRKYEQQIGNYKEATEIMDETKRDISKGNRRRDEKGGKYG